MKICPACQARFDSKTWACPSCAWRAVSHQGIYRVIGSDAIPGFSSEFFGGLVNVEGSHFWFEGRNALIAWAFQRYFPAARSFLEVGCGTAQVTAALRRACPGLSFTASEGFLEGLTAARRNVPGAELVQADVTALPWEGEFDVIGAFDVLEHVAEDAEAARQISRALRAGGGVIVTVPQHDWLWSPVDDYSRHQRRYTRSGLVRVLEQADLTVERVTSFVSLLLPALVASRASQRGRPVDPYAEYRISPLANRVGALALRLERILIRAGVSLPAGGSLLAIARKRPG